MSFFTDLDQSQKTVVFVHNYLKRLGYSSEIVDMKPSASIPHPPDILIHLQDGYEIGLEVKEDVASLQTKNIYFERNALMKFARSCVTLQLIPFLCYVPYCCPRPNLLFLCDEMRDEFNVLYRQGTVKKVYGGDNMSTGWIIPYEEFILLSSNITTFVFEQKKQTLFEKRYKDEFFNESNHFYHRFL
jgi:hypothetical protein